MCVTYYLLESFEKGRRHWLGKRDETSLTSNKEVVHASHECSKLMYISMLFSL